MEISFGSLRASGMIGKVVPYNLIDKTTAFDIKVEDGDGMVEAACETHVST